MTSGLISFQVLWDYDITNATKTTIPYFNEANAYRGINDGVLEVSVLNTVTAPDSGAWTVTGAATVDDDGIEREFDFVPTQGVGNNSSGGVSSDRGFRIYGEGTGALIRIVSEDNDNTVLIGYDWIEAPSTL